MKNLPFEKGGGPPKAVEGSKYRCNRAAVVDVIN